MATLPPVGAPRPGEGQADDGRADLKPADRAHGLGRGRQQHCAAEPGHTVEPGQREHDKEGQDEAVRELAASGRPGLTARHQESPSYSASNSGSGAAQRGSELSSSANRPQSLSSADRQARRRPGSCSGGSGSSSSAPPDHAAGCSADGQSSPTGCAERDDRSSPPRWPRWPRRLTPRRPGPVPPPALLRAVPVLAGLRPVGLAIILAHPVAAVPVKFAPAPARTGQRVTAVVATVAPAEITIPALARTPACLPPGSAPPAGAAVPAVPGLQFEPAVRARVCAPLRLLVWPQARRRARFVGLVVAGAAGPITVGVVPPGLMAIRAVHVQAVGILVRAVAAVAVQVVPVRPRPGIGRACPGRCATAPGLGVRTRIGPVTGRRAARRRPSGPCAAMTVSRRTFAPVIRPAREPCCRIAGRIAPVGIPLIGVRPLRGQRVRWPATAGRAGILTGVRVCQARPPACSCVAPSRVRPRVRERVGCAGASPVLVSSGVRPRLGPPLATSALPVLIGWRVRPRLREAALSAGTSQLVVRGRVWPRLGQPAIAAAGWLISLPAVTFGRTCAAAAARVPGLGSCGAPAAWSPPAPRRRCQACCSCAALERRVRSCSGSASSAAASTSAAADPAASGSPRPARAGPGTAREPLAAGAADFGQSGPPGCRYEGRRVARPPGQHRQAPQRPRPPECVPRCGPWRACQRHGCRSWLLRHRPSRPLAPQAPRP